MDLEKSIFLWFFSQDVLGDFQGCHPVLGHQTGYHGQEVWPVCPRPCHPLHQGYHDTTAETASLAQLQASLLMAASMTLVPDIKEEPAAPNLLQAQAQTPPTPPEVQLGVPSLTQATDP